MNDLLKAIQFDFLCALTLINNEPMLMNLYINKYKTNNISIISYQYKKGNLKEEVFNFVQKLFNERIARNNTLLEKYIEIKGVSMPEHPKTKDPYKSVKRLPTKFGKKATEEKIKYQNGNKLLIDELSLATNDLRNQYAKVLKLVIHDIHRDEPKLTEDKITEIINGIKKLKEIIND